MTNTLLKFLHMGGYGFYVWTSYASVIALLLAQWLMPWRRWQKYLRELKAPHEQNS
jgi:heme exporter protein CcmD